MSSILAHIAFILLPGVYGFYISLFIGDTMEWTKKNYIRAGVIGFLSSLFVFLYWFSLFGKYYFMKG